MCCEMGIYPRQTQPDRHGGIFYTFHHDQTFTDTVNGSKANVQMWLIGTDGVLMKGNRGSKVGTCHSALGQGQLVQG